MASPKNKYYLTGFVGRWYEPGSDPGHWTAREDLKASFRAKSDKEAIEIAREKVKAFLEKHKELAPDPNFKPKNDWDEDDRQCSFRLVRILWRQGFEYHELGEPAKPAKPEKKAKYVEKVI